MRRRTIIEIALASATLAFLAAAVLTPWYHIIIKDRDDPAIVREEGIYYLQEYQEIEYYSDTPLVRTAPSYEPRSFIVFERVGILMDLELLLLLLAVTTIVLSLATLALKEHFMGFGLAIASCLLTVIAAVWFFASMSHAVEPMGLTEDTFWGDGTDMSRAVTWGPSIGWFLALAAIPLEIGIIFALHKEWKEVSGVSLFRNKGAAKEAEPRQRNVNYRKMAVAAAVVIILIAVIAVAYVTVIARSESCVTLWITHYDPSDADPAKIAIYLDDELEQELSMSPGLSCEIVLMLDLGSHTIGFDYVISQLGEPDGVIDSEYSIEITDTDERKFWYDVGGEFHEL